MFSKHFQLISITKSNLQGPLKNILVHQLKKLEWLQIYMKLGVLLDVLYKNLNPLKNGVSVSHPKEKLQYSHNLFHGKYQKSCKKS